MAEDSQKGSALQKALSILEAVVGAERPLGLTDLAARVGLPKQTVHRIVRQLEGDRLVRREPGRDRYTVGPRLGRLALDTVYAAYRSGPMRAVLRDLVATIGETCNVGLLDGHEVVYVDRVESDWPLRVELKAGSRVPVHCTAIGKLLLADLPTRARRRFLAAAPLARYTPNTITDPDLLSDELQRIRTQGYSLNDQEYAVGMIALAVPIRDPGGRAIAALAVHAPAARLSPDAARAHLATLTAAAARLADALAPDDDDASHEPERSAGA